ncbi:acyl carrier protein [Candidatus Latescibacterota bacterium]
MSLDEQVKNLVISQLGVDADKVTQDSSFIDDLGADSLDTVELVMAFEEEFDMEISDEEAQTLKTVGDVVGYLKGKVSE